MNRAFTFSLLLVLSSYAKSADTAPSDGSLWWVGHAVTFVGTVVAALMIVYQLGRQHKNETYRQNENFKAQLRLQIYQEFSTQIAKADDLVGSVGAIAVLSHTHSVIYKDQANKGFNPEPIKERPLELHQQHTDAVHQVIEVVFLIEKYMIIHPDLDIFRTAFSAGIHDASAALDSLSNFMFANFPVDDEVGKPENVRVLSDAELAELRKLATAYQGAMFDLGSFLADIRVELQGLLIGHLFPNVVPRRRPSDPSSRVITLEPANVKSLRQYFLKNTEWGRRTIKSQLEVHDEYHGRI